MADTTHAQEFPESGTGGSLVKATVGGDEPAADGETADRPSAAISMNGKVRVPVSTDKLVEYDVMKPIGELVQGLLTECCIIC